MAKNSKAVVFVLLVTIGMFFTIFAFVAQQTSGSSSQPDPAATCSTSQYATGENSSGSFLCGSASNSNYLTTQTAVSTEASATCPIGQVAVNESVSGTFSCGYPNGLHGTFPYGNLTGFPSACLNGLYVTQIGLTVTCNDVPYSAKICSSSPCNIGVPNVGTFAVIITGTSAIQVQLPRATSPTSYYIGNNSTQTASICPNAVTGNDHLYVGGQIYTNANEPTSCFKLTSDYQILVWADATNWNGVPSQIQWSSITAFPAACSSGQFVNTNGATNTCSGLLNDMQNNTKSCADVTSGTVHQMGFKLNFTTTYSTNVSVTVNFQITTPATITLNTKYRLSYGTGNAPACNAVQTGTGIGNQYELLSFGGTAATTWSQIEQFSLTAVIQAPTANTAYWVDVQALDSSGATWTYALPTMTVIQG